MQEKHRPEFTERLADVLGDILTGDIAMITLRAGTANDVVVGVALKTDWKDGGVIRGSSTIPMNKATPGRILAAAESSHATLTGAIAIFAAQTPGFEEESDVG